MAAKARRAVFSVILALASFCAPALAAAADTDTDDRPKINAVSVDVFLPLMSPVSRLSGEEGTFLPLNVKYQRGISGHVALMFKAGLNYNWWKHERSWDIYPMVALEWHPFHKGLKGFYVGPSAFFNYSAYSSDTERTEGTDHYQRVAFGGNLGWQFAFETGFIVDLTFGLGYGYDVEVDVNGKKTTGFATDETIAGVFVGYRF